MTDVISALGASSASATLFCKAASGNIRNITDGDMYTNPSVFTSSLPSPIKQYTIEFLSSIQEQLTTAMLPEISSQNNASLISQKVDKLEVSIRSYVLSTTSSLLDNIAVNDEALTEESMEELLKFVRAAIDLCHHILHFASLCNETPKDKHLYESYRDMDSDHIRKLPFLLLEDVVDTLPISAVQLFWKFGPSQWLQPLLCNNQPYKYKFKIGLFTPKSKYCLIRLCNRLLKNLSVHSQDEAAQFAGEISITFANVFPLSERSAVNVLGAFHVESVVDFENSEEWLRRNSGTKPRENEEQKNNVFVLDYQFYSDFWDVQRNFTDPQKLLPKTTAAAIATAKKQDIPPWNHLMEDFSRKVRTIFSAFEGHSFSKDVEKHLKTSWAAKKKLVLDNTVNNELTSSLSKLSQQGGDAMDIDIIDNKFLIQKRETKSNKGIASSNKYLTNSQLLNLQLQDPEIRINVLTQFLIISRYLSASISNYAKTKATTAISKNTSEGDSVIVKTKMCQSILTELTQLEKRADILLCQTPPNGERHAETLRWILKERESIWKQWKKAKCAPPVERFALVQETKKEKMTIVNNRSRAEPSIESRANFYSYKIDVHKDLPAISRNIAKTNNPEIHGFLEDYVEALDPDAGIEAEYHPKNDKLFAWRALRLLARKCVGDFGSDYDRNKGACMIRRKDGDFEGLVRKIWKVERGVDIPGKVPEVEEISEDEDCTEKQKVDKGTRNNTEEQNDIGIEDGKVEKVNMDNLRAVPGDTSTSTPATIIPIQQTKQQSTTENGNSTEELFSEDDEPEDTEKVDKVKISPKEKEVESNSKRKEKIADFSMTEASEKVEIIGKGDNHNDTLLAQRAEKEHIRSPEQPTENLKRKRNDDIPTSQLDQTTLCKVTESDKIELNVNKKQRFNDEINQIVSKRDGPEKATDGEHDSSLSTESRNEEFSKEQAESGMKGNNNNKEVKKEEIEKVVREADKQETEKPIKRKNHAVEESEQKTESTTKRNSYTKEDSTQKSESVTKKNIHTEEDNNQKSETATNINQTVEEKEKKENSMSKKKEAKEDSKQEAEIVMNQTKDNKKEHEDNAKGRNIQAKEDSKQQKVNIIQRSKHSREENKQQKDIVMKSNIQTREESAQQVESASNRKKHTREDIKHREDRIRFSPPDPGKRPPPPPPPPPPYQPEGRQLNTRVSPTQQPQHQDYRTYNTNNNNNNWGRFSSDRRNAVVGQPQNSRRQAHMGNGSGRDHGNGPGRDHSGPRGRQYERDRRGGHNDNLYESRHQRRR